jgi:cytochrome oxidase Cu insertion factor (SCO1/SenC/PrrC family)
MSTHDSPPNPPSLPAAGGAPKLAIVGLLLAVLLIGAAAVLLITGHTREGVAGIGGPFALMDGNRKPVTDQDFRGKYMLV